MNDPRPTPNHQKPEKPPPLQFGIKTLLGMMVAVGLIFGTLRWIGASEQTSYIVMGILTVSLLAAVGLIVAISRIGGDDP
jgi:magnesium-transporting ATPase (P-type)